MNSSIKTLVAISLLLSALPSFAAESVSTPAGATAASTATSSSPAAGQALADSVNKPVRDKWALIVGIGDFNSDKIPKLKYATKDARDFYNYLIKEANFAPDHVRILLDGKATQRRIMSELGSKFLARLARPDDMIVLFF